MGLVSRKSHPVLSECSRRRSASDGPTVRTRAFVVKSVRFGHGGGQGRWSREGKLEVAGRDDRGACGAITPEQLFEVLADADAWPRWASVITKVTWTSPEPRGVGTTRTVNMRGGIIGDEEYLIWKPFIRMAFRFNNCSTKAVAAFAEDYRVEVIPGGCRITWTLAQKPVGRAKFAMLVVRPVLSLGFRRFLSNLRRYTDKRYATTSQG
jgi:hypothetical protein